MSRDYFFAFVVSISLTSNYSFDFILGNDFLVASSASFLAYWSFFY